VSQRSGELGRRLPNLDRNIRGSVCFRDYTSRNAVAARSRTALKAAGAIGYAVRLRYVRSQPALLDDSMGILLPAVEMNPRTLCFCQPVALMISALVARSARLINSRILAPLLAVRGVFASFDGFEAFSLTLAGCAALAVFGACLPVRAFFLELGPFP
jgi:hypothetical protein